MTDDLFGFEYQNDQTVTATITIEREKTGVVIIALQDSIRAFEKKAEETNSAFVAEGYRAEAQALQTVLNALTVVVG